MSKTAESLLETGEEGMMDEEEWEALFHGYGECGGGCFQCRIEKEHKEEQQDLWEGMVGEDARM